MEPVPPFRGIRIVTDWQRESTAFEGVAIYANYSFVLDSGGTPEAVEGALISWNYFGLHMIQFLAGLQQNPRELGEAAALDGATAWQRFRYVTLPLLGPTLRVSIFLSIIGALQLFDLVWVTTKGGPIGSSSTMATYLYDQFRKNLFGYASAVSIVIFLLSLVIALLYQRFALRRDLQGTGLVG